MRILILTGDAGESLEIYYPKYRLEEEGWEVRIAAPGRRTIQTVVHDFEPGFDTYTEKLGYRVAVDLAFDQVKPADFDALVVPGGRAPEYLRNRPDAVAIVRHFVETGKPIGVTCHGPLILIAAGGVEGRTLAAYPELAPDVRLAGGIFEDREVVVDGLYVSARAWPDNGPWMREFVKLLKGRADPATKPAGSRAVGTSSL